MVVKQIMMNFKTSKKLKDQGFPQPVVEEGQNWYTESGMGVVASEWMRGNEHLIFAPTTSELIEQIVTRMPEITIGKYGDWHVRINETEAISGKTLDGALVLFWEKYLNSEQ